VKKAAARLAAEAATVGFDAGEGLGTSPQTAAAPTTAPTQAAADTADISSATQDPGPSARAGQPSVQQERNLAPGPAARRRALQHLWRRHRPRERRRRNRG
jgi:hypothetical protein